jgi:hypothetical protein
LLASRMDEPKPVDNELPVGRRPGRLVSLGFIEGLGGLITLTCAAVAFEGAVDADCEAIDKKMGFLAVFLGRCTSSLNRGA